MNSTETKYAKLFPLNRAVRYSSAYRAKFPHANDGSGFVTAIKFRSGMVPAITVSDGAGKIIYAILADNLEPIPTIAVEL